MDQKAKDKIQRLISLLFYCLLLPLIIYFLAGCETDIVGASYDQSANSISTSVAMIDTPTLLSPADRSVMDNGCVASAPAWEDPIIWEFTWSLVESATKYQISIRNRYESIIQRTVTTPGLTYICPKNSDEIPQCDINDVDTQWRWRVRAGNDAGWGKWSTEREFTVEPLEIDCHQYAYLLKFGDAWPPSPSPIEPDSAIKIHLNYFTPYYLGAFVKIVPYFEGDPWPDSLYQSLDEVHYPPAYNGRIVEVDLHINAAAQGKKIDKLYFEIQGESRYPKEFLHIPVEYTIDKNSADTNDLDGG